MAFSLTDYLLTDSLCVRLSFPRTGGWKGLLCEQRKYGWISDFRDLLQIYNKSRKGHRPVEIILFRGGIILLPLAEGFEE